MTLSSRNATGEFTPFIQPVSKSYTLFLSEFVLNKAKAGRSGYGGIHGREPVE
jgi:hypothetical protein